jgi:hypothetical protein
VQTCQVGEAELQQVEEELDVELEHVAVVEEEEEFVWKA